MPKCSCGKRPSFNVPGESRGVCCKFCKTIGMINIVSKKCPCGKIPYFNLPGKKPVFCSKCKTGDMIDVKHKRCSCGSLPVFNVIGEPKGVCCSKCKTDEMIDVVSPRCLCGKRPYYNVPGEIRGVCCKRCKTDEMIDIKSKRCICGSLSIVFNLPGEEKGVCCSKCKTDEMIDVKSKRCICGSLSTVFNLPSEEKGVCCSKCKTGEMINVVSKICPGYNGEKCPVRTYIENGYKYCMPCDPNDARRKRYKQFEDAFFAYVKDKLDVHKREFHVPFDQTETAKKFARLDGVVFGDGVIVCLEVDENGHQDYICDEHRMHLVTAELLQKYPDHIVSWVRVNPTTDEKTQTSKKSQKIREKRFGDVVVIVNDILKNRYTRVVYIGFC